VKVADLFINIGLKGGKKVKDGMLEVGKALSGLKLTAFEAKAGIFGAVLALEEMTRRSVGAAVDLKNFAGSTGLSTQELQKWNYWAEMNDIKAEEMTGTIRGLQQAQAALALGEGVPAGAVYFGLNQNQNAIGMLNEIQKKIRAIGNDQKEIAKATYMLNTLGISPDLVAAFRIGSVGFGGLRKEMVLTGEEQKKLLDLNREWHSFWLTLKGTAAKTTANDLAGPIKETVSVLKNAVLEISDLIHKLSADPALKVLEMAFKTIFLPFTVLDAMYRSKHGDKNNMIDIGKADIDMMKG